MTRAIPRVVVFRNVKAKVLIAAGPWRSSGRWWQGGKCWGREEWDVALAGDAVAGVYRIVHDLISGHWFVEGMYD